MAGIDETSKELWKIVGCIAEESKDGRWGDSARHALEHAKMMLQEALNRLNIPRPRTCGDCRWIKQDKVYPEDGFCTYKTASTVACLPISIKWSKTEVRLDTDATKCPCFLARQYK